jgi:hypothetical protein
MDLFDDIPRSDHRTPLAEDTKFSYLNASARPEAATVRAFLEHCLSRYPAGHRDALVTRLRSIDTTHDAAVFELLVHEMLIRAGNEIVEVEPAVAGRDTNPDFLVRAPAGTEFIVECVMSNGESSSEASAQRRLTTALDAASAVPSPVHFLAVKVQGVPSQPISLKALKRDLSTWIAQLPDDEGPAKRARPLIHRQHGLQLVFSAMVKRKKAFSEGDRSIGSISYGLRMAVSGDDLRASLLKKANKYGQLPVPYVIAVNGAGDSAGERDLLDALLGSTVGILRRSTPDDEGTLEAGRSNDGVLHDGRRPRKRGVSAILSFDDVSAWRPWGRGARLLRNPWATRPLPDVPLPVDQLNPGDGEFVKVENDAGAAMFGLDPDWP